MPDYISHTGLLCFEDSFWENALKARQNLALKAMSVSPQHPYFVEASILDQRPYAVLLLEGFFCTLGCFHDFHRFFYLRPLNSMNIALQYVSDSNGKHRAVQLTVQDWEKVLRKLKKYEQALRLQSDLTDAFDDVTAMQQNKKRKQPLSEFLNEL
jgi:hypothetical protein